MQSGYTGHVAQQEWRWVIWVSSVLIVLAFVPFMWVILSRGSDSHWEFMGALHDYENGAVYLSKIYQGTQDRWLTLTLHTPEPHRGTFFDILYAVLGQASRLTFVPPVAMFHIARVAASLFMYMTLYQLAASIWMRLRTRRIFFLIAAIGSGFGWLLGPLTGNVSYLDIRTAEAFPFFSSLVNVHFPLAIACLALLTSIIVPAFRPGATAEPTVENGGVLVFVLSLALVFIYPLALASITLAIIIYLLIYWYRQKRLIARELRWLLWFGAPSLPMLVYYVAVLRYNPVAAKVWWQQNSIPAPSVWVFALSFGIPLITALPGIWRAVRRFEQDGDQFLLVWLLVILALIYLPTVIQRRFAIGIMIPIAYFAARSLEDFWFNYISRRYRFRIMMALLPVVVASNMFVLFLPTRAIVSENAPERLGIVLEPDYLGAFDWLSERIRSNDVILAAPSTSLWLPAWTGARVVAGHPADTIEARIKEHAVIEWFTTQDINKCQDLLDGEFSYRGGYTVRWIVEGPQERALGQTVCLDLLQPVATFNDVTIYLYTPTPVTP